MMVTITSLDREFLVGIVVLGGRPSGTETIVSQHADGWAYSDRFQRTTQPVSIAGYLVDSSTWHKGLQTAQFFTAAICVTPFVRSGQVLSADRSYPNSGLISLRDPTSVRDSPVLGRAGPQREHC